MPDPITAEIIRNYMESVAEQTIQTMVRTSVSPIFNEAHDCSAGVFYYDGEEASIVARADAIPVHIYGALTSVQACLDFFHGDLSNGDVLIVCDPYFGGTHLGDYTVVVPVFYDGQPMFFPAVRAHTLDQGGPTPSGFSLASREVWHEGFRYAPLKLYEKGELRREVWDLILRNNRLPELLEADIDAMIGGCRVGADRIRSLCDKYGLETVRESVGWSFDYSEKLFREQIRQWPDGVYRASSLLDSDFAGRFDLPIEVALTIDDDEVFVDFEGTAAQSECITNSVPGNTMSYVYTVFSVLCPDIPINSGFFRPVTANLPPGSVVNPREPAAAAYATICIGCDIGDALMKAAEGFAPRSVGTGSIDLTIYLTHGVDARNGRFFVQVDYQNTPVSSGGTYGVDGWGAWSAPFCALVLASVEMTEVQYPCLYRQAELTTDSAAPGQWRGSPAHAMQRGPYNTAGPAFAQAFIQGLRNPLHGFQGGRAGAGNFAIADYGSDDAEIVTLVKPLHPANPGSSYFFSCGGGGGWGDALDRDPAAVLADVLDEYVSLAGAGEDYGVIIDPASETVDEAATDALRARLRSRDAGWLALGRRQTLERTGVTDGPLADHRPALEVEVGG